MNQLISILLFWVWAWGDSCISRDTASHFFPESTVPCNRYLLDWRGSNLDALEETVCLHKASVEVKHEANEWLGPQQPWHIADKPLPSTLSGRFSFGDLWGFSPCQKFPPGKSAAPSAFAVGTVSPLPKWHHLSNSWDCQMVSQIIIRLVAYVC
jgi:hypothetical protein